MAVVRRVYLYGIAFVALWMLVSGLGDLLSLGLTTLAGAALGAAAPATSNQAALRTQASYAIALTVIGLVGWLVHWALAERSVRRDRVPAGGGWAERGSAIRLLFLYAVLTVGGLVAVFQLQALIRDALSAGFGQLRPADLVSGGLLEPLARLGVLALFGAYYLHIVRRDRALLRETRVPAGGGWGATLRRWCVYGLAFVGLMLWLFAAVRLLGDLVGPLLPGVSRGSDFLAAQVASDVGWLLTGLLLWAYLWLGPARRAFGGEGPDSDRASVLRKVYLYLALAVTVMWTVWNVGRVLYLLLGALLIPDRSLTRPDALIDLVGSVANGLVFGLAWLYHARVVVREAAVASHTGAQRKIRWLYEYLVTLVGIAAFGVGLAWLLNTALEAIFRQNTTRGASYYQDQLSFSVTLLAVGLPLWLAFWTRLQREAALEPSVRPALVRRIYLFLVFGVAVLTLFGAGVTVLFRLVRAALGEVDGGVAELIEAASAAAVAAVLLVYHLRVLRADWTRRGEAELAPTPQPPPSAPAVAVPGAEGVGPAVCPGVEPAATPLAPAASAALVVVQAEDAERLAAFRGWLTQAAPTGVRLQIVDVSPAAARDALRQATGATPPTDG